MSNSKPLPELIQPILDLEKKIDKLPDGPRKHFIACTLAAAELAIRLDKPVFDIPDLLSQSLEMAHQNLQQWDRDEGMTSRSPHR